MRNGIYRVWVNGPRGKAAGAVVLKDGDLFSVDPQFAFNGVYQECGGRFAAVLHGTRLYSDDLPAMLPDVELLHLRLEGAGGDEFAQLEGRLDEVPGLVMSFEYAFLSEA